MSLKSFHLVFIGASVLLAVFLGVWGLNEYFTQSHRISDLLLGAASLLAAVGLVVYGRYFLKKLKNIDFL